MAGPEINIEKVPDWFHTVGSLLAVSSGVFIGLSLILQKIGLIDTASRRIETRNQFVYLKSVKWWIGILFCSIY